MKTTHAFKRSKTVKIKSNIGATGRLRATLCEPALAPKEYADLERLLAQGETVDESALHTALVAYHEKAKVSQEWFDNVTTDVGRAQMAYAMWNNLISPKISYIELGSGTNTPAVTDTALQTPVYRNALASGNNVSNVVRLTGFFNQTETSGTYREAGMFMGGSLTLGTGIISSRVAINITKTGIQSLTIEWEVTLSDA